MRSVCFARLQRGREARENVVLGKNQRLCCGGYFFSNVEISLITNEHERSEEPTTLGGI